MSDNITIPRFSDKRMSKPPVSPNKEIDELLKTLLKKLKNENKTEDAVPMDIAVKVINSAMAWEKIKHQIQDTQDTFDPDSM